MQHLTMKGSTTQVDQELGTFTALVSGWTEDRMKDTILPSAFDRSIAAWKSSGKRLPLLFEHSTKTVGSIDPASMYTNSEGLVVSGEVDRSTDEGKQVWRQIKSSTASFSIGFASESRPRKRGKGREIYEIDLLEISATSTPAHPSTRVLDWKSMATFDFDAAAECPDDLIGTHLDPVMVTDSVEVLRKGWAAHEREVKARQPIQIVSFRC